MEYLFKKEDMLQLIKDSPDSDTISVTVTYQFGDGTNDFKAFIEARAQKGGGATPGTMNTASGPTTVISGCPNPPGCR